MARDLQDSVDKLETTLRAIGTRAMTISTDRANRRLDSFESLRSARKRIEMIEAQSKLGKYLSIVKESNKLFAADAWMAANPANRFKSAADKVRFDEIISERRKRDRTRGIRADKSFNDKMLSIINPDLAYRKSLESEYQFASQGGDVAADEIINAERSEKAKKIHQERRKRDRMRGIRARQSFRFAMLDSDEQFIQGAMRDKGWSRDQAEQVYFKNLTENTKWLRFIARDNPKIAKNLIPIAKAVGKASGLPFIGGLFANPMTAITALGVGAVAKTVSGADEANATIKKWKAYEGLYGNPTDKQKRMARLAGINDVAQISKVYGRLNVRRGDAEAYLTNMGMAFRTMDERSIQLIAEREGLSPEEVRLAKLYAGESASRADIVDANIEQLKEVQQRGFETGSGAKATMKSLSLSIPYMKSAVARGMMEGDERFNEQLGKIKSKEWSKHRAFGAASNYRLDDPEKYQAMVDAINRTWNEVHDVAIADDQYAAGKFEIYNDATDNSKKEVNVQMNLGGVTVQPGGDARGFVDELIEISTGRVLQSRAVIDAFDTKRKK